VLIEVAAIVRHRRPQMAAGKTVLATDAALEGQ
jgi:hypothetical protein